MSTLSFTLVGVGAVEALCGAFIVFAPFTAIEWIVGRTFTIGASHTGVAPLISQLGSLRLTVSLFLLSIGLCGSTKSIAPDVVDIFVTIAIAYCGFLQPYMLLFRGHQRMPVASQIILCLLEGFALLISMAAESHFNIPALSNRLSFVFATVVMVCSLLVVAVGGDCLPHPREFPMFKKSHAFLSQPGPLVAA